LSAENGPTPTICTDKALYFLGDTLEVAFSYWHYGKRIKVDIYVGLLTSGIFLMLDPNYNLSSSITPFIKGIIVDPAKCEEVFYVPFINFKLPMFTPTGLNFFLTVVTETGSQNWASELNYVPFLIAPPVNISYYVDVNTGIDKPSSGKTPNNPWKTITYALSQIGNPQQPVLLNAAQGIYSINSGEKFPLQIAPKVYLRGEGASKTELNATGSNACHVIECNSKSPLPHREYFSTIIEGFKITGGNANGTTPDDVCGGGIFCHNFGMAIFQNNIIEGNIANEKGGGIYISNSLATIHHNTIQNNKANYGGALYLYCTIPETNILANTIIENTAIDGAGIYYKSGSQNIRNNLITKNVANENGGGIYCQYGYSLIANNLIKENKAENGAQQGSATGGGICIANESTLTIQNDAVIGNKAIGDNAAGGGIYCAPGSTPSILNNTIAKNEAQSSQQIDLTTDLALGGQGGGIHCTLSPSSLTIKNCAIFKNIASHRGGGIRCQCASPEITNNMIRENISDGNGGGICCSNSNSNIKNNTIVKNEAPNGTGGGFWSTQLPGMHIPDIRDCIIYNNVASTSNDSEIWTDHSFKPPLFCCIKNWSGGGTGNISDDPIFENGPFGDYYLKDNSTSKSPCIDSGSQTASKAGLADRTTTTKKGSVDKNIVDLGYHYLIW
jgi:parallel beta-helix repeat protein